MTFFKNKKIYYVVFITLLIGFSSFFIYKKTSFDSFKNIEKKEISKYSKEQFIKNTLKDKNVFNKEKFSKYIVSNFNYFLRDNKGVSNGINNFIITYDEAGKSLSKLKKLKAITAKDYLVLNKELNKLNFENILNKVKNITLKNTSNDIIAEKEYFEGLVSLLNLNNFDAKNHFLKSVKINEYNSSYYNYLGNVFYSKYNFIKAIDTYEKGLSVFNSKKRQDLPLKFNLLFNLANAYETINENQKAINTYNYILMLSKDVNDLKSEYLAVYNLALLESLKGNYKISLDYLKYSLKLATKLNNKSYLTQTFNSLSITNYKYGNYEEGKKYGFKALKLSKKLSNLSLIANSSLNICLNYEFLNKKDLSKEYCNKAVNINEKLGKIINDPRYFIKNGNIYSYASSIRDYENSLNSYREALKISHLFNLKLVEIKALFGLSEAENILNNKAQAIGFLNKAMRLKNALNINEEACDNCKYGFIYWGGKKAQEAIRYYEKAFVTALENDDKSALSSTTSHLASIYFGLKDYKKAMKYSTISLNTNKKIYKDTHHYINYQEGWQKEIKEKMIDHRRKSFNNKTNINNKKEHNGKDRKTK